MRSLESVVRQAPRVRAVVAGDLILDRYVEGDVSRINPEAPVPVVRAHRERFGLGGAANTALNLAALGAEVRLLGAVGEDEDGALLCDLASKAGIDASATVAEGGRITTRKTRVISRSQHLLRVDWETDRPLAPAGVERLADAAFAGEAPDILVLSDYAKGVLTEGLLSRVLQEGRKRSIPVLVDPKGREFSRYAGAYLVTPNRAEAEAWSGSSLSEEDAIRRCLASLKKDLDLRAAVITLGSGGLAWIDDQDVHHRERARAREVFDVTGAGDTVLAALAFFLGAGAALHEAARLANVAAGIAVGRVGAVAVSREEILERILDAGDGPERKFVDRSALEAVLEARRRRGSKIVFTNGCFDVLHRGHVEFLRFCRAQGDFLVVGLNSDRSVRALKGPSRPVNAEADRAAVLAALESVDLIAVFDEDTPERIIETVKPDVLVKGEDWREKGVVGREFVEGRGGKVVLAPLVPGYSTTEALDRMREREGG